MTLIGPFNEVIYAATLPPPKIQKIRHPPAFPRSSWLDVLCVILFMAEKSMDVIYFGFHMKARNATDWKGNAMIEGGHDSYDKKATLDGENADRMWNFLLARDYRIPSNTQY